MSRWSMAKKARKAQRRKESLSRNRIIEASIELLDSCGEDGLTYRALADRLASGPGAIYWHIADKSDLLTAACDTIVARTMEACLAGGSPKTTIRALALGVFDAIDAHPWVGSALASPAGQLPVVRILEPLGPANPRSRRAGRRRVGRSVGVAQLRPGRRWAKCRQRAARSNAWT